MLLKHYYTIANALTDFVSAQVTLRIDYYKSNASFVFIHILNYTVPDLYIEGL